MACVDAFWLIQAAAFGSKAGEYSAHHPQSSSTSPMPLVISQNVSVHGYAHRFLTFLFPSCPPLCNSTALHRNRRSVGIHGYHHSMHTTKTTAGGLLPPTKHTHARPQTSSSSCAEKPTFGPNSTPTPTTLPGSWQGRNCGV